MGRLGGRGVLCALRSVAHLKRKVLVVIADELHIQGVQLVGDEVRPGDI